LCCLISLDLCPERSQGATGFRLVEGRNVKLAVYPNGSMTPAITIQADRVFIDHHRMGFFKVRVMPMVVAEGLRVGIAPWATNLDWPASIRSRLLHFKGPAGPLDGHNLKVCLLPETAPRLEALRFVVPPSGKGAFCALEDVTLRSGADLIRLPRARLPLEGHTGRIAWEEHGAVVQWDLVTTNVIHLETNQTNLARTP
jgi:hypothetical protein